MCRACTCNDDRLRKGAGAVKVARHSLYILSTRRYRLPIPLIAYPQVESTEK